ncbi:GAF domain-containing protein [Flexibacter flexilis DSM 6793]|uniref:histidine kinase n=1 Tax=Flexibacter flexilis DSM 6793 TaxID=927664 RepID=A0A1I1H3A3_9BACT|nr:GAF domain-containing protein [Flexibacter flexilis]SFC16588.1 GAF domain-containing protein [Flexibacter flexilis DSM 6793]
MKKRFSNFSIRQNILLLFSGLLLGCLVYFFITRHYFNVLAERELQLDVISFNRSLVQKMLLDAEQITQQKPDAKENLRTAINEYQKRLNITSHGGRDLRITNGIRLHPSENQDKKLLQELESQWKPYKAELEVLLREPLQIDSSYEVETEVEIPVSDSVQTDSAAMPQYTTVTKTEVASIPNPAVRNAMKTIVSQSPELFKRTNNVANFFFREFEESETEFEYILILVVSLSAGSVIFAYRFLQKQLLQPLTLIEEAADQISKGNLNSTIEYSAQNEIGKVSLAINNLAANLRNAAEFVKKIGDGNLDTRLSEEKENNLRENSLSGALVAMREQMKTVAENERQRNWTTEGLAKFVDIFRHNTENLNEFSFNIISNIIHYVKANQGGIFLVNDDNEQDKHLQLMASYAFGRQKHNEQRIEFGEGLTGQCYLEKQSIFITEIPEEFVRITSGLGGGNPRCLLFVPLKLEDKVLGVIELASFQVLKPFEIAFLEKLAENIASTLASVKINQHTKRLLEESQEMTEHMRAQEEEMRQNVEELEATQEEMARKESELRRLFEDSQRAEEESKRKNEEMQENIEAMRAAQLDMSRLSKLYNEKEQQFNSLTSRIPVVLISLKYTPETRQTTVSFISAPAKTLLGIDIKTFTEKPYDNIWAALGIDAEAHKELDNDYLAAKPQGLHLIAYGHNLQNQQPHTLKLDWAPSILRDDTVLWNGVISPIDELWAEKQAQEEKIKALEAEIKKLKGE